MDFRIADTFAGSLARLTGEEQRAALSDRARLVIRIGGRRLKKADLRNGLLRSLANGLDRKVCLVDTGVTSKVRSTQANSFRGAKASQLAEHDSCFNVEA